MHSEASEVQVSESFAPFAHASIDEGNLYPLDRPQTLKPIPETLRPKQTKA